MYDDGNLYDDNNDDNTIPYPAVVSATVVGVDVSAAGEMTSRVKSRSSSSGV